MDNEELSTELTAEEESAFDEAWGDAPAIEEETMDLTETEEDTHSEDEDAESEEEALPEEAQPEETPAENGEIDEGKGESTFTLKHMGENHEVGLEEMLMLASKGMDYDGLKADRDRLRDDPAAKQQHQFLEELAKRSGAADIAELQTRIRAAWLVKDEEAAGRELSESDAILRVQRSAAESKAAETEEAPTEAAAPAHDSGAMFRSFIAEFPDVKSTDIPQEVWSECAKTGDLTAAYRKYEYARMKAENETLRKNQENRNRSTGSRKTSGATIPKDAFDEGWDSIV